MRRIAEASNLLDAMRDLLAQMPAGADALTVTGVRRDGRWRVQGSIPVQRPAVCEPCGIAGGGHRDWCPVGRRCCGPWFGLGHAPTCERTAR